MNVAKRYKNIVAQHPDFVTKKELCEICGIAPKTATALEQSGKIPFQKEVDGLLHYHRIKLTDVIAYLYEKECWQSPDSPYMVSMRNFYEQEYSDSPEILLVSDIQRLTGYSKTCVTGWLNRGKLKGLRRRGRFSIPKSDLIDFAISPYYRSLKRKSVIHIEAINRFEKTYIPPKEESYA